MLPAASTSLYECISTLRRFGLGGRPRVKKTVHRFTMSMILRIGGLIGELVNWRPAATGWMTARETHESSDGMNPNR